MPRKQPKDSGLRYGEGTIAQRPSGGFQAQWIEAQPDGRALRRSRTFPTRDQAEDHLRTVYRSIRDGRYVPPSERTVAELVRDWLDRGQRRWKPSTHASYRQRAEQHVIPPLGNLRAETLTTPRVQHWVDGLVRAGYDASTIDGAHRVLGGALREAVQLGIIPQNSAAGARKPPVQLKESTTWTAPEVGRIMALVARDPMLDALYRMMLTTGIRPGEARAIAWRDLDLAAATLQVRRTMTKDLDGRVAIGSTTKTNRSRTVALTSSCVKALNRWRLAQKERRLAAPTWHDLDLVFDRGDGRFLPLTTWQKRQDALCRDAGVSRITLHELRHTSATISLESGQHPLVVSQRLGHRSIQTTLDVYSHVSQDLARAAAEALDNQLFGDRDDDENATTRAQ